MEVARISLGVDVLDFALPKGVLRNSFIILAGSGGSGKSVFNIFLSISFLKRGEPVIYVSLDDDPATVITSFKTFNFNLKPYMEKKLFGIVDAFSFRLGTLKKVYEGVVREVDPRNSSKFIYALIESLDYMGMDSKGLLILDSLNEIFFHLELNRAIELIKTIRALVSKAKNVLTIATFHTTTESLTEIVKSIEHLIDGLIELKTVEQPPLTTAPLPLWQLIIRKMKGAPHSTSWVLYTITEDGIKPVVLKQQLK